MDDDAAKRARKVAIQKAYFARKKAAASPEQLEAMRQKARAYSKAWRDRDPEHAKALQKAKAKRLYDADPETARLKLKAYRAAHPDQFKQYARNRDPEQVRAWGKESRNRHLEKRRAASRAQHAKNKPERNQKSREWYAANIEYARQAAAKRRREKPDECKAQIDAWRVKNKDWTRKRYRADEAFVVACRLRARLQAALKRDGGRKSGKFFDIVGCTRAELVSHVESLFLPGMTWENRAEWHLDHIRQVATFDLRDPVQQRACFALANLRPLWAVENLARPRPRRPKAGQALDPDPVGLPQSAGSARGSGFCAVVNNPDIKEARP